jgi:hypothetical protein
MSVLMASPVRLPGLLVDQLEHTMASAPRERTPSGCRRLLAVTLV